jgi:hypothetical protein
MSDWRACARGLAVAVRMTRANGRASAWTATERPAKCMVRVRSEWTVSAEGWRAGNDGARGAET